MSIRNLSHEEISSLFPIRNFSDNSKSQLQTSIKTELIPAGTVLFSAGSDNDCHTFLLEGKLKLKLGRDNERVIEGGQIEARFPIDHNSPHKVTATALSSLIVFSAKNSLIDNLMNEQQVSSHDSGMDIIEAGEDNLLYNQLYFEVTQEMQADKLLLPSIPETAVKVRSAISDPHITSEKIANITQQDPAITAQLIKVANSPLFRGREKIEALPLAITRLGLQAVSNLITSFTMRMVFNAKTSEIKGLISILWLHSRDVAGICAVIAKKLKGFNPDKAMLVGLVHDIGAIPILTHADKHPNLTENIQAVKDTLEKLTPLIGKMVLDKWNFTDDFTDAAINANHWQRKTDQPANYTDLVIIAQLLSYRNTPLQSKYPEPSSVPAYERLSKLLRDQNDSLDVIENSQEELNNIKQLFN
ncbi:metal-dependent hydrolase [Cycloclasticus sp. 46_120_T64]|nr:metal-dependent hydrolase [Cycloclasticus sp. 46_120_T64]